MPPLRYAYQTIEFGLVDIHLRTLRDVQQYADPDGIAEDLGICSAAWPLFGIVWDSSRVLANLMLVHDIENKRILEVGCGIALSSLMLNKRRADITATDYHPEAGSFLEENTRINADAPIPFVRNDWRTMGDSLGRFDLIIGSDILYEVEQAQLLSSFIEQHAQPACEVIIVDPGRKNDAKFTKKMIAMNFDYALGDVGEPQGLSKPFKGRVLCFQRQNLSK